MTNKKLIFGVVSFLILLIIGFSVWKILIAEPVSTKPDQNSSFVSSNGSRDEQRISDDSDPERSENDRVIDFEEKTAASIESTATSEEIKKEDMTQEVLIISGFVVSGGDTTPEGLFDAPRKFVYTIIDDDDDTRIDVSYTAYPPSPFGDREMKKIKLTFYAGTIKIGDYLKARGTYDSKTNTLNVANEGDYLESFPKKQ